MKILEYKFYIIRQSKPLIFFLSSNINIVREVGENCILICPSPLSLYLKTPKMILKRHRNIYLGSNCLSIAPLLLLLCSQSYLLHAQRRQTPPSKHKFTKRKERAKGTRQRRCGGNDDIFGHASVIAQ